jgi:hypothetical protein
VARMTESASAHFVNNKSIVGPASFLTLKPTFKHSLHVASKGVMKRTIISILSSYIAALTGSLFLSRSLLLWSTMMIKITRFKRIRQ